MENGTQETEEPFERPSLVKEFWYFLAENKKWWLLPIVVVVAAMAALMWLGQTPAAPFIYSLF